MKKVFYLLTTLLLISILSLAACGGGGGSQSSAQENNPASEAEAEDPTSKGDPAVGGEKYGTICIACHGPAGEGIQGLGKNLVTSEFVAEKTNEELVEFIKVGRQPGDPVNTTGVAMPPKGGNPALTDDDLHDIVAFIRTFQQ